MEEGQRHYAMEEFVAELSVLILVVMEEGQRQKAEPKQEEQTSSKVLILVVMEEGQRQRTQRLPWDLQRLNPCCNGRGSKTL